MSAAALRRRAGRAYRRLFGHRLDELARLVAPADLAIFHEFDPPPGGGGHQFLRALAGEWRRQGYRVENNTLSRTARACLFNSYNFDGERLARLQRPGVRFVQRVDGPIGLARGHDQGLDRRIWEMNQRLAGATIFQSQWSLEQHRQLGMEFRQPTVIHNTPEPAIFHPHGRIPFAADRRTRLVAVSWSDNPNKGAAVIQQVAALLDPARYELTFIGRSPLPLERMRVLAPLASRQLAEELRRQDIFITASRFESCSNALLEALACGLPAVYIASGAHAEIAGAAGLPFEQAGEVPALLERVIAGYAAFQAGIALPGLADVASRYLAVMGVR